MPVVTLYGKPDCPLCDKARAVVMAVRREREFDLREVDISLDTELQREYGERIPVVAVDGRELFQYHVDPDRLHELVGGEARPAAGGAPSPDH